MELDLCGARPCMRSGPAVPPARPRAARRPPKRGRPAPRRRPPLHAGGWEPYARSHAPLPFPLPPSVTASGCAQLALAPPPPCAAWQGTDGGRGECAGGVPAGRRGRPRVPGSCWIHERVRARRGQTRRRSRPPGGPPGQRSRVAGSSGLVRPPAGMTARGARGRGARVGAPGARSVERRAPAGPGLARRRPGDDGLAPARRLRRPTSGITPDAARAAAPRPAPAPKTKSHHQVSLLRGRPGAAGPREGGGGAGGRSPGLVVT
jgi:hypothetical protein